MSGFCYSHEEQYSPDVPSQHHYNFVHANSCSLERDDDTTIECFQGIPFYFGLPNKVINATSSFDAVEVPDDHTSDLVCGLNKTNGDDHNADTEITAGQKPKRRKKNNSKKASMENDEKKKKKMKGVRKMEKEGESRGTPAELGYVHVRARRGQATDSHSLAERVRREKIGVRMKMLQSLVPGCDKIAGKTQVLDEIINYVQSLQTQLQILVRKLSILSPSTICSENNLEGMVAPAAATTQGTEFLLWESDEQGHISAFDEYWLGVDHLDDQLQ